MGFLDGVGKQHGEHRVPFRILVNPGIGRNVIVDALVRTASAKKEAHRKTARKGDFHGISGQKIVHQPRIFAAFDRPI